MKTIGLSLGNRNRIVSSRVATRLLFLAGLCSGSSHEGSLRLAVCVKCAGKVAKGHRANQPGATTRHRGRFETWSASSPVQTRRIPEESLCLQQKCRLLDRSTDAHAARAQACSKNTPSHCDPQRLLVRRKMPISTDFLMAVENMEIRGAYGDSG